MRPNLIIISIITILLGGGIGIFSCQNSKLQALNRDYGELKHAQATCIEAMMKLNEASIKWQQKATKRSLDILREPIVIPEGSGPDIVNEVLKQ